MTELDDDETAFAAGLNINHSRKPFFFILIYSNTYKYTLNTDEEESSTSEDISMNHNRVSHLEYLYMSQLHIDVNSR